MYSIDLSASWTSQTVSFKRIDKLGVPVLNIANLWKDPSNSSFYMYNGEVSSISNDVSPPENELWRFTPSGNTGNWSNSGVSSAAISNFTSLVRVTHAASVFGDGFAFVLGGFRSWRTSGKFPFYQNGGINRLQMPVGGVVTYDMASGSWSNMTNASLSQSGSFSRGELQYLSDYGTAGLLIPLGGQTSAIADTAVGRTTIDNFSILSMYDIASGIWHTQKTSGGAPPGRMNFCSVGVKGDDGTFEVRVVS